MKQDVKNTKSICIITHMKPDVDALASSLALADFLENEFKLNVDVFAEYDSLPENYNELASYKKLNPKPKKYDVAIMIDSPNSLRLGKYSKLYNGANKKVVIDHHATNDYSGDINIVELVSSSCQIVYSILKKYHYQISNKLAEFIYAGIMTDTNNFTVGNFDKKTFDIVAELSKNINIPQIYQKYFSNSLKSMYVFAKAILSIEPFYNGSVIFAKITNKQAKSMKIESIDYEGIINRLSMIANVKFVCFVYPQNENFYVSMRAKQNYDVSNIAKDNGGGGHKGAAAFYSNESYTKIKNRLLKQFVKQLK